jgi:hypothetical protein
VNASIARVGRRSFIAATRPPASRPPSQPLVAILCAESRARMIAAGVALALMRACGTRCALAAAVGEEMGSAVGAMPAAHRAARGLRERGVDATASGRLAWVADARGPLAANDDVAARAAACSAELGRAAIAVGAPAAVAFPLARTAALDRVLAWHDAIVVVREPQVAPGVVERALASLAELGRPVAAMAPPRRSFGALTAAGLLMPPEAKAAVAGLAPVQGDA